MNAAAKVGVFFVIVLIIAGVLIWRIEELRLGKGPARTLSIEFKDVAGLDNKSAVRLAGVRVGKVKRIRLRGGKAMVEVELDRDVELRQGGSAAVASLGLLGEKYVELVPGPVGANELPEGATIRGEVPVTFDEITRLARDIEVQVKDISTNLNQSLGGALGEERLKTIVDNVRALTEDLKDMVASNRANVDATVENFKEFSGMMTKLVERVDALVAANQSNVTQGIANIKDISGKLETTADNLNQITGRIRQGEGTVGKLVQSEETHANLNDALVAVKEGVQGLNKALSTYQKAHFDLGVRSEYLTRPSKGKGYFTLQLDPAQSPRFYRLEISSQPIGRRVDTTTVLQTTFPDGHSEVTTTQTQEFKDEFAISALLGWRWKDFALRAGVIESRGGAGLDYKMLRNRFRLSADVWDFNRTGYSAHAKLAGSFYVSPSVFVTGGWDDLLNRSHKADSVFVGAGLRWTDDDLKYLLGSSPIKP